MAMVPLSQCDFSDRKIETFPAKIAFGRDLVNVDATVTHLGLRSMRLSTESPFELGGRFLWVDVELPGGRTIRPLVEVVGQDGNSVSARYRHIFPNHQPLLAAHYGTGRTAAGY